MRMPFRSIDPSFVRYQSVKAVTFDATNTIIGLSEPVGRTYADICEKYGLLANRDAVDAQFRLTYKRYDKMWPCFTPVDVNDKRRTQFADVTPASRRWWYCVVADTIRASCLTDDTDRIESQLPSIVADAYDYYTDAHAYVAEATAKQTLETLTDRGYKLGIISNTDERLRPILEQMSLMKYFHSVLLSAELKMAKPSPEIFKQAVWQLNLSDASELLHVGDSNEHDCSAAVNAGCHAMQVRPNMYKRQLNIENGLHTLAVLADILCVLDDF